jgi:hypothetical protein
MVLHGLGGMGKSQLALEYAHAHQEEYSSIWWISVPNISQDIVAIAQDLVQHHAQHMAKTAQPDYHRIAITLGLPTHAVTETGRINASSKTIDDVISAVKRWLSAKDNKRWLMIMDNHDDLQVDVGKYLPSSSSGRILITSRVSDSARLGDSLELGGIREEDAIEILRKSARRDQASFETRESIHVDLTIDSTGLSIGPQSGIPL